ncbi:MAG: hypothetical protein HN815_08985 [Candidatus Marinimicrobia bacterium]|nr:hypothetical protein [Candidatus Neomarinimicrobiota bacterium]MBT4053746.1 hypothetical protein [Candidatus Neomarinimicrobiota bacterium]MBT4368980.1 hypothetical protein [Candidatus Neomarinimicrobiota bacterium]MBT5224608.1 hypothetical protein [Candidatus Neomarinimicrobiota bacterium]MBT6982233.1 hypothetical protein [Candidatus Neomarinimicrobiota bacterium]
MKKTIAYTNIFLLLLLFGILNAQNDKSKIVGIWEFQTITSIYYSDPQETSSTRRDNNQQETLIFHEDGTFNYHGVDEGSKYASIGSWNIENTTLSMDAGGVKTICDYEVTGDIMTLTVREEESEEFYKTFSVLKYKNKIISR